jgi:hypothetical protein
VRGIKTGVALRGATGLGIAGLSATQVFSANLGHRECVLESHACPFRGRTPLEPLSLARGSNRKHTPFGLCDVRRGRASFDAGRVALFAPLEVLDSRPGSPNPEAAQSLTRSSPAYWRVADTFVTSGIGQGGVERRVDD